ncbi:Hypothetical protein I5071_64490 [Sandaracinus amylolyticus]|nr:Hypothetical protein I5071_64490 [Sandaracinus amylolyticus]
MGVCPVREDTEMLAAAAAEEAPGRALDLGTGTGYVAVYLALRGFEVDAVDVSPRAIAAARANAERNGVAVRLSSSSLFSAATGTYDVIASNPPQRERETELSRLVTSTLLRSLTISTFLMRTLSPLLEPRRLGFLEQIASGALDRLRPGGRILLVISPTETAHLLASLPRLRLHDRRPVRTIPGFEVAIFTRASQ